MAQIERPRVSVVVRRMYYWDLRRVRLSKHHYVSVVVRRMYYWDVIIAAPIAAMNKFQ